MSEDELVIEQGKVTRRRKPQTQFAVLSKAATLIQSASNRLFVARIEFGTDDSLYHDLHEIQLELDKLRARVIGNFGRAQVDIKRTVPTADSEGYL